MCYTANVVSEKNGTVFCELIFERYIFLRNKNNWNSQVMVEKKLSCNFI